MHVYVDYQGRRIRLTEERLAHILNCVVVKITDNDAFILTAYLVSKPAGGRKLWPKDD